MTPHVRDLFDEVPVSFEDIDAWLVAVPRIDPESPRAAYYVKNWDVPAKIRQAKLAGMFESIVTRAEHPGQWWQRFHWTR